MALVRPAGSAQDGVIFLTAAFAGLRSSELVAAQRVRVCGVYTGGRLTTPKRGKGRSEPLGPAVAEAFELDDVEPKNEKDRLGGRSNPYIGIPPSVL